MQERNMGSKGLPITLFRSLAASRNPNQAAASPSYRNEETNAITCMAGRCGNRLRGVKLQCTPAPLPKAICRGGKPTNTPYNLSICITKDYCKNLLRQEKTMDTLLSSVACRRLRFSDVCRETGCPQILESRCCESRADQGSEVLV